MSKYVDTVKRESYILAKNKNGITLVALVVTLIILLILAGISIASLTGSGLFEKAKLAKEKQENAEIQESEKLGDYENKIGEYVDGTRNPNSSGIVVKSLINKNDGIFDKTNNGYIFNTPTSLYNITSNNSITLNESIENFNYIIFETDSYYTPCNSYINPGIKIINIETIKDSYTQNFAWEYGDSNTIVQDFGNNHHMITCGFKNSKNIYVWNSWSSTGVLTKIRITDIKGVKY